MPFIESLDLASVGWHIWLFIAELAGILAAIHALFHKRDPRSALVWVAFCVAFPVLGVLLYVVFGRNRVRRVARSLKPDAGNKPVDVPAWHADPGVPEYLYPLDKLSQSTTHRALQGGNRVTLLGDGESAYAAMLAAIEAAQQQILLASYIFDAKGVGASFVDALSAAAGRGVEVRVLVDGVGEWYSFPRVVRRLRKAGVMTERFRSPRRWSLAAYLNLRNHRKILVVDGSQAFAGGMNIRNHHVPDAQGRVAAEDLHFELLGPVAQDLAYLFIEDWQFVSRQPISNPPALGDAPGHSLCRLVEDGPDENLDKLTRVILAAIHQSRERLYIITPYFLPPREIMIALQSAALRGVDVRLLMPAKNNLPFVGWASRHILSPLLQAGVRAFWYEDAFLHTKLLTLDGCYTHLGSYNLDPRSLRLNFELGVEVHDASICQQAEAYFLSHSEHAREVTADMLASRPFLAKLRDAVCWLFSPYL